jgi:hypothetical protein
MPVTYAAAPTPVVLTIVPVSGGQYQISWPGSGGTLYATTNLVNGSWTAVPGNPASPYTFSPNAGQMFFEVR